MKKLVALLSIVCFIAFVSNAQTPSAAPKAQKETVEKSADTKATSSGCSHSGMKCCSSKNGAAMKDCTPAQKAACEKTAAGKADAAKTPSTKSNN